jgi:hypothetical protein
MATSVSVRLDRVSSSSVKWTVNATTTKSGLFVEFHVAGRKVASYLGPQNAFGSSGEISATGNVYFNGFAQGNEGATSERAQIQGIMETNQNMMSAADQV